MHKFKDFKVWHMGMNLVTKVYLETKSFPPDERFGLTSQVRRCASSIPTNIAEGCGRNTDKDFSRFLGFSLDSAYEFETHILIALNVGYISKKTTDGLIDDVQNIQRILYKLIQKFDSRS